MTINIENVTKWVEALESGEYQQGKEALNRPEGFCCLGVLCDLAGAEWLDDPQFPNMKIMKSNNVRFSALPPQSLVASFLGGGDSSIDMDNIRISTDHVPAKMWGDMLHDHNHEEGFVYVTSLNDKGATFTQIAAMLRKQFGLPPREVAA